MQMARLLLQAHEKTPAGRMENPHKDNNSIPFRANEGFPVFRKAFANYFDILLQIAAPILYVPLL